MGRLKITQVRSTIKRRPKAKKTIEALGLGRPNHSVVHDDTPQIRGMIRSVQELVDVEELDETDES